MKNRGKNSGDHAPLTGAEKIFLSFLEETPLSFALWRTLEYKVLRELDFREPLLDLGCGEGMFSSILFHGKSAVGVDVAFRELKLAERRGVHKNLVVADGCLLPFRDSVFATVFSNCVIEHVSSLDALLAEARRVLAPGGRFICTVPGERLTKNLFWVVLFSRARLPRLARLYGDFVNRMLKHAHRYSDSEWAAKLESAGFRVGNPAPLVSAAGVRTFELGGYSAVFPYLIRLFLKRWFVFPRIRKRLAPRLFLKWRHLLDDCDDLGGGLMLIGVKPVE